jgi:hypothetical protein
MQIVFYRPMAADYPAKLTGRGVFVADVIPVGYRGFLANCSLTTVFYYGFYVFPLFLSSQKTYAAGGTDTPPFYPAVVFLKAAFPYVFGQFPHMFSLIKKGEAILYLLMQCRLVFLDRKRITGLF